MNPDNVQMLRDVVVALAASITAVAAWRGLTEWRTQMIGKEKHRVAANLLRNAILWREGVKRVRNPMMFAQEMEPLDEDDEARLPSIPEERLKSLRGYMRRWESVEQARANLDAAVVEAELYLGDWPQEWYSGLLLLEADLKAAIYLQLSRSRSGHEITPESEEEWRRQNTILFAGGSRDEIGPRVDEKITRLRELIGIHLE